MLWFLSIALMLACGGEPIMHQPDPALVSDKPAKNRAYYESRGEIVWEVPMKRKMVALTFDDGPDPRNTPKILDLLRDYGGKATFFVLGKKAEQYPEVVSREALEGHEIANHTFNHVYLSKRVPISKMVGELTRTHDVIEKITGQSPRLFRPPGGYYNEKLVQAAKRHGYLVVLWSWHQDTRDWRSPGVNFIVRKVLDNVRNGDIILFHDAVEGRAQTAAALKIILPELKRRGYSFVTVSQLLENNKLIPAKKQ